MINEDKYNPEDLKKLTKLLEDTKEQHSLATNIDNSSQEKNSTNPIQSTNKDSEVRSKIYLLVKKFVQDIEIETDKAKDKSDLIDKIANRVTNYLINKILQNSQDDKTPKIEDTKKASADLRKVMKNFAVYALYKVMNPRRIAGETKADNFIHNATLRGAETAKHYTGGSSTDINNYSPSLVKNIDRKRKSIKKGTLNI